MPKTVEAIYEDGVLKPVERLELSGHQRVELN
jgi:predicted DNA-binding antitoxin AbrB/MazE fold protein